MNSTIRTLALSGACLLATACTEQRAAPQKAEAHKAAAPRPAEPMKEPAALTGLSPNQPHTILDRVSAPAPVASDVSKAASVEKNETPVEPASSATSADKRDEAAQEDAEADDRAVSLSEIHIVRFVLATGIEAREPVGETDTFTTETEKIFAFVQLENADAAPYAVKVYWEKVEGPASLYGVKLEVPTAQRWRTWSWTRIRREPGHYRAVLRTPSGEEIASREFVIEAEPSLTNP
jgi:hypothetical protein